MAIWIKVETHTPDKAEIRHIARLCHCTKAEAFLAFFRVTTSPLAVSPKTCWANG